MGGTQLRTTGQHANGADAPLNSDGARLIRTVMLPEHRTAIPHEQGMNPLANNLAVLAGHGDRTDGLFDLHRGEFHGTAFGLAPELFITAAHVYEAAAGAGQVALARLGPSSQQIRLVRDADVFPDIDLALMHCPNLTAEILPMNFEPLDWLTDVFSFGYVFGLEVAAGPGEEHVYHLRAFRGHVMTRRGLMQLKGVPPGYEVSFVPPPGLSGAALLVIQADGAVAVTGVVLQHHVAELAERRTLPAKIAETLSPSEISVEGGEVSGR